jgi:hypothetical protein
VKEPPQKLLIQCAIELLKINYSAEIQMFWCGAREKSYISQIGKFENEVIKRWSQTPVLC